MRHRARASRPRVVEELSHQYEVVSGRVEEDITRRKVGRFIGVRDETSSRCEFSKVEVAWGVYRGINA